MLRSHSGRFDFVLGWFRTTTTLFRHQGTGTPHTVHFLVRAVSGRLKTKDVWWPICQGCVVKIVFLDLFIYAT